VIKMAVKLYLGDVQLARGTSFDYEEKYDNSKEDTFDGRVYDSGEFPEFTCKISRVDTYNAQYETIVNKAIAEHPDGLTLTVVDGPVTDIFTGCILESRSVKRDPKSKRKMDLSFLAQAHEEKRTNA